MSTPGISISFPDEVVQELVAEGLATREVELVESRGADLFDVGNLVIGILGVPASMATLYRGGRVVWRKVAERIAAWRARAPDPEEGRTYKLGAGRGADKPRFDLTDRDVDVEQLTLWLEDHEPKPK